jgi:hypothetical protein
MSRRCGSQGCPNRRRIRPSAADAPSRPFVPAKALRHVHIFGSLPRARCVSCEGARHTVPSPHSPSQTGVNALMPGGGTGRGVATAHRARTCFCAQIPEIRSLGGFVRHRIGNNRSAGCTPLPVPPPHGGRERCGTALPHRSRCIRVRVRTCLHAIAPSRGRQQSRPCK